MFWILAFIWTLDFDICHSYLEIITSAAYLSQVRGAIDL